MLDDVQRMVNDMDINLNGELVIMAFTLSKQSTVANDFDLSGAQQLSRLNFIEFLEFFARIADLRFLNSEMEEIPLD